MENAILDEDRKPQPNIEVQKFLEKFEETKKAFMELVERKERIDRSGQEEVEDEFMQ